MSGTGMRTTAKKKQTIRIALVDDEYYALQNLQRKLQEFGGTETVDFEIVGLYEDVEVFLQELGTVQPDVVFLDVEMPKMSGFVALSRILESGLTPQIIFVTAFSQYAVKAFEFEAIDYILKPVSTERLQKALDRIALPTPTPFVQEEGAGDLSGRSAAQESEAGLQIHCFRSFSIKLGGTEFCTGWKTKKAEELLAYLICEKGRFASKEKIAEDLWPEVDGDKSQSSFHVANYHLKQQEKNKGVSLPIESERGRMRFHLEDVWCDLLEFDRLRGLGLSKALPLSGRIPHLEKAVELYGGALLEDRFYEWAVSHQQKYRIQHDEMLGLLVQYYQSMNDERKAKYYKMIQPSRR